MTFNHPRRMYRAAFAGARHLARAHTLACAIVLAWTAAPASPALAAPARGASAGELFSYEIRAGDTLIGVAQSLLAQPKRWPEIKRLNRVANDRRLQPGAALLIPVSMLRQAPTTALIKTTSGEATREGVALKPGEAVRAGDKLNTGADGFVTVELADGSQLKLGPSSAIEVGALSQHEKTGMFQNAVRVVKGRVESIVRKLKEPSGRFVIETPQANVGVRGTVFRVGADSESTQAEVLEGGVAARLPGVVATTAVAQGFGMAAKGGAATVVKLLPPPQIASTAALQERLTLRFPVEPIAGAAGYRAQIAQDAQFNNLLAEATSKSSEVRFVAPADGNYHLRVRAIDGNGIEGNDAALAFRLKARPEPPVVIEPIDKGKVRGEAATLKWSKPAEASGYRLQVASDQGFAQPLVDQRVPQAGEFKLERSRVSGTTYWRLASIRGEADQGPFGDATRFEFLPPQAPPEPPAIGPDRIGLRWSGEPAQRFELQLATDAAFQKIVGDYKADAPQLDLKRPAGGTYWLRLRAIDADGFIGAYTAPQRIDVPRVRAPCIGARCEPVGY